MPTILESVEPSSSIVITRNVIFFVFGHVCMFVHWGPHMILPQTLTTALASLDLLQTYSLEKRAIDLRLKGLLISLYFNHVRSF